MKLAVRPRSYPPDPPIPALPVRPITPALGPVRLAKIFRCCSDPNHVFHRPSHPIEGRLAIVTNVRWDAMDGIATTDERG